MHTRPFTHGRTLICITNKMFQVERKRRRERESERGQKVFGNKKNAKYVKLDNLNGNEKLDWSVPAVEMF